MKHLRHLLGLGVLLALVSTASAQSWLTNGLVAYYPFNGNANDASGNGNDAQLIGKSLFSEQSWQSRSSLCLDGQSGYAKAALPNSPTTSITVSAWVNYTNLTGYGGLGVVSKGMDQESALDWHLGLNQDIPCRLRPHILAGGGWIYFDCNSILLRNTWYHIAMTYDGSNIQGYVNGLLDGSTPASGNIRITQSDLRIGAYAPVNGLNSKSFFPGYIANIRIYKRALSPTEVAQLYQTESGPGVGLAYGVKPTFNNLWVGTNYQLQVSSSLAAGFTNYGSAFTATNTSMIYPNYFDVANWNQLYFRLRQQ